MRTAIFPFELENKKKDLKKMQDTIGQLIS
jgi:hypothetical protein